MSHRLCLYNTDAPPAAGNDAVMLLETAYDIPSLLVPLLGAGGRLGPDLDADGDDAHTALYFDAPAGIERLRTFHAWLGSQPGLIDDPAAFEAAHAQLFGLLDTLEKPCFHLDLRDLFALSDDPAPDQARAFLADLARRNDLLDAAIAADDVALLDAPEAADLRGGLATFAALLNDGSHQYGWGWFAAATPADMNMPQPFELDGRWGLRDATGAVIVPPYYDALYDPGPLDRLVAMRDGKYGYLDLHGRVVIPLAWDDAYDFDWGGLAAVARGGKLGLIDIAGRLRVATQYDEIDAIGDHGDWSVCLDGRWGVLDRRGIEIITCTHAAPLEPLYADFFTLAKQKGVPASLLFHRRAGLLAGGYDELIGQPDCVNLLVVRTGKRFGAIGIEQAALLLPQEFDSLDALPAVVDRLTGSFMLATKGTRKGVFDADPDTEGWLFPLDDWEDVISLNERRFAVKRAGRWHFADSAAQFAARHGQKAAASGADDVDAGVANEACAESPDADPPPGDFDLIVEKPPIGGHAYAFHGKAVWVADDDGLYPADPDAVQADLDFSYGIRFSREARRRLKAYVQAAGG
jgi:hypothetical protein